VTQKVPTRRKVANKRPALVVVETITDHGPPDPEVVLPKDEREKRKRARWAFGQLRWHFQEARTTASIGYQAAKAGWREARALSQEDWKARHELLSLDEDADKWDHVNLELASNSWHRYYQTHAALAENGAAVAIRTIDKLFRQFAERINLRYDDLAGGPRVGSRGTSFLELVRAGGNWSRHRHEWFAKGFKWDDDHANWSVRVLSRCDVYHLDDNVYTQIVDKMEWATWVAAEEALVTIAYRLTGSAFRRPYRLKDEDRGYWNEQKPRGAKH
jgi:hypothetical protein